MFDAGAAITSGVPDPTRVPPQLPEYQFSTGLPPVPPLPPIAVKVRFAPTQTGFGVALTDVGGDGKVNTVTVTLAQPELPQTFSQRA